MTLKNLRFDWDRLRILHADVEAGSFSQAATILKINQSSVSRHIQLLERDLNTSLFNRHPRGLILTEQGQILSRTTQDVVMRLDKTQARLMDDKDKPAGLLRRL